VKLQKAGEMQAWNMIYEHLQISDDDNYHDWLHKAYEFIPSGLYKVLGMIDGPDGFPYIVVHTTTGYKTDNFHYFEDVAQLAMQNNAGIAIYKDEQLGTRPDIALGFGAVWSFFENGAVAGNKGHMGNFEKALAIDSTSPHQARISGENTFSMGEPSELLLPLYVRELISQHIRQSIPDASPHFFLMERDGYAMKQRILVELGVHCPEELSEKLLPEINWFMPPYLPISFKI
jgi:hypothetical protein